MSHPDAMLHEQREWLRVTLSSIGDAVITTDNDGKVTFLNPVAEALTDWKLAEALGVTLPTVFNIVNEETRQPVENPATKALREGLIVGLANHTLLIGRDGAERPIDDSAAPIRDLKGDICGVVLVFRDVTERREKERALRESEERFRLLVDSVKDYAIFMLDPNGFIVSWNAGAEDIKGYTAAEIIGRHFSVFYTEDAVATNFPATELEIASKVGRFEDEGWRLRKDGSTFWANVVITAVRNVDGKLTGFAKVTRDLTERRKLEQSRARTEALAELNRRKDEFLAMLSHELRNPLAPIRNAVQLLQMAPNSTESQQSALSILERQVTQMARLVDDLLDVSRITTGRVRLQLEDVDLRAVIQRAAGSMRSLSPERQGDISLVLPPEPVIVPADPTRIEQVAVNLLSNSLKYSSAGQAIRVAVEQDADTAILRVQDSGEGIAPDLLASVFDLFTQAERSLDRSQGGLGVGLTIVQKIIELHQGQVEVFSAGVGQGSEFVVRLPRAGTKASEASEFATVRTVQESGALRVLVVDDNQDAANSLAMLLRALKHDARAAYSGEAAIQSAAEFQPHVVFLDIGLPEINGFEVARRLRQIPSLLNTRIAALTGYGRDSDQQQSRDAGIDLHLVKPADVSRIREFLADVTGSMA